MAGKEPRFSVDARRAVLGTFVEIRTPPGARNARPQFNPRPFANPSPSGPIAPLAYLPLSQPRPSCASAVTTTDSQVAEITGTSVRNEDTRTLFILCP